MEIVTIYDQLGRPSVCEVEETRISRVIEGPTPLPALYKYYIKLANGSKERFTLNSRERCLCGAAYHDDWTGCGIHHQKHHCARVGQ